jgi:hypothetical protein
MSQQRNLPARASAQVDQLKAPAMPTCERHRIKLMPGTASREGRHGERIDSIDWAVKIYGDLISVDDCNSIIAEVEAASVPAPPQFAARFAALLIGSYPARELGDAAIFSEMLKNTFAEYPSDIGLQAVDALTRQNKWLPSRAELVDALEDLMKRRRHAGHVAQAHLSEHEHLAQKREKEREREELRRQIAAEQAEKFPRRAIVEKWRRRFDRGQDVRSPRYRSGVDFGQWNEALVGWTARFGFAEVDRWHQEIADAPHCPAGGVMAELVRLAGEAEKKASANA